MKKLLCAASIGLAIAASVGAQAADKIAVANIAGIFEQSPQRAEVAKKLESEFKTRATDLQTQQRALQAQMQNLQRNSSTMKASERNRLQKEIMTKRQDFETKAQAFEKDNQARQMQERNKILTKIQDAVKSVATKEGYDIVIDSNSVAYAANAKDITSEVLKQVK